MSNQNKLWGDKRFLIFLFVFAIIGLVSTYFYLQNEAEEKEVEQIVEDKEADQIEIILRKINEGINLMDAIKNEMPRELLETHEHLMSGVLGGKLYRTDPRFQQDVIMYHGARTRSIFINPTIELKKELWIPIFYHEVAHNHWHTKYLIETFEEFQAQLLASENYASIVSSQAWDLVMKHYPIRKEELKIELEQRLFKIYSRDTEIYTKMLKNNLEAKELWDKINKEIKLNINKVK